MLLVTGTATSAISDYVDATGAVVATDLEVQRIVSLAPNVSEMLCYLGYRERIVGRTDYCDWPAEISAVPAIGGFVDASLEAIIASDPDLVIAYQGNSLELVEQLRILGITVLALGQATSLDDIAEQLDVVAMVVGGSPQASCEATQFRTELAAECELSERARFSVLYGYPGEMVYTCAPGTFLDDVIQAAGGINVITDDTTPWPQVSAEFIIATNPDVILTGTSCTAQEDPAEVRKRLLAELQADPVWSGLSAVGQGQLIVIDADILHRPGPRILDALREFKRQLAVVAPELVPQEQPTGVGE